jgi:hypothetical protein
MEYCPLDLMTDVTYKAALSIMALGFVFHKIQTLTMSENSFKAAIESFINIVYLRLSGGNREQKRLQFTPEYFETNEGW